jgi:RNA polymerase sigma-70 factor (ECF subfamily)
VSSPPSSPGGLARPPEPRPPAANAAEFDRLLRPLFDDAYRLALVILRSPHEAEDAVQEATVKAWLALGRLRDEGAVRTWFLRIVANQCRSMRRTRWFGVLRLSEPPASRPDPGPAAAQAVDLSRALSRLGSDDRTALFLHFNLDLPLPEVAAVLRISESAARSRVYRALKRLRPDLEISEVLS